jgi:hypothetical protein
MAGVVLRLVLRGRFGEEKWAPVGDAADHATRREYLLASCAGDSGIECQWVIAEGERQPYSLISDRLPGRTLGRCQYVLERGERFEHLHTTAISSYSISSVVGYHCCRFLVN